MGYEPVGLAVCVIYNPLVYIQHICAGVLVDPRL